VGADRDLDGSVTGLLKRVDPLWWWLRENFRLPSLGVIASVIAGAGVWLFNQRGDLRGLQAQQKTLATADQVAAVQHSLDSLKTQLDDQGGRIDRLERNWDDAGRVLDQSPPPRRRLPRRPPALPTLP
jgi:hypothetical protein